MTDNDAELLALKAKNEKYRAALEQYADRKNWGYLDGSGCPKGMGAGTDFCQCGPEIAEDALRE